MSKVSLSKLLLFYFQYSASDNGNDAHKDVVGSSDSVEQFNSEVDNEIRGFEKIVSELHHAVMMEIYSYLKATS